MSATSRKIFIHFVLILVCAINTQAKVRQALPPLDWGFSFSAAGIYNDNLLKLSDRDKNNFFKANGAFPDPLSTTDDIENELTLKPVLKWRAPMTLMATAQYHLKFVNRANNSFTNYQTHSFSLSVRPRVTKSRWQAKLRLFAIPSFYLRTYKDKDYNQYHAVRFANYDYNGSFRYKIIRPLWLEFGLGFGTYYYNSKFTEYDSEISYFTGGANYAFSDKVSLNLDYTRNLSDNVGKSQQGLSNEFLLDGNIADTEYGDSDFTEDDIRTTLTAEMPFLRFARTEAALEFRHRRRVYTTSNSLQTDPFHRSRLDNRWQISPMLKFDFSRTFGVDTYFVYEQRTTDSDYSKVALAKNFIRREAGIVLNISLR